MHVRYIFQVNDPASGAAIQQSTAARASLQFSQLPNTLSLTSKIRAARPKPLQLNDRWTDFNMQRPSKWEVLPVLSIADIGTLGSPFLHQCCGIYFHLLDRTRLLINWRITRRMICHVFRFGTMIWSGTDRKSSKCFRRCHEEDIMYTEREWCNHATVVTPMFVTIQKKVDSLLVRCNQVTSCFHARHAK